MQGTSRQSEHDQAEDKMNVDSSLEPSSAAAARGVSSDAAPTHRCAADPLPAEPARRGPAGNDPADNDPADDVPAGSGPPGNGAGRGADAKACCSEETILAFVEGRLEKWEIDIVDAHMRRCPTCAALAIEALHVREGSYVPSHGAAARCRAFETGDRVAERYVVRDWLGQGGMGDVYEAYDLELDQRVAIKMARAATCDDPLVSRRLALEVKLARRVCHPSVCRVHDVGVHVDTRPRDARLSFISMELIEGESLAQRLARGERLPRQQVQAVGRELLLGISAIHGAGVIHRDIKSSNVMLRQGVDEGAVAIIDFGLAVDALPMLPKSAVHGSPTGLYVEGSPAYMAPEQFEAAISPASDIFAFGVVLFEALTGKLPFVSLGPGRKVGARRNPREAAIPAGTLIADVPARLEAFLARCLRLDPDARYSDALEALADLDSAMGDA